MNPTWAPRILRTAREERAPKTSSFENQGLAWRRTGSEKAPAQAQSVRGPAQELPFKKARDSMWKGLFVNLKCRPEGQKILSGD